MTGSATAPAATAATSAAPQGPSGPGITRSSPALAAGAVLRVANQSDMTRPGYAHSPLTMSLVTCWCSVAGTPLMLLYAAMTDQASDSATAISNGSRYSSRRVASSTTLSIVLRSVSDSLATRCLRQAPTPLSCSPRTYAAASLPVSNGSSEYDSNSRPPSSERCRLTVGPRTTWICCAIASSASNRPTSYADSSFQAEASSVALGNNATVRPPKNFSPRTPVGPSDSRTSPSPIRSHGASVNPEAPVSSVTLSRRESVATSAE